MTRCYQAVRTLRLLSLILLSIPLSIPLLAAAPARHITLDVREADVHNVLRMLARVGEVNLVISDRVSGRVTVRLQDVPWQDALQAVLVTRGLKVEEVGSILQVDTLAGIRQRAEERLAVQQVTAEVRPLETILIPLSYADVEQVRDIVRGMLSERGRVTSDTRTNTLIVTDDPAKLERVLELVGPSGGEGGRTR